MSSENQHKKKTSMSVLDQLKAVTVIVADTGDFEGKNSTSHNLEDNSSIFYSPVVIAITLLFVI